MTNFSLTSFSQLLQSLLNQHYRFLTYEEYLTQDAGDSAGKWVILRHDVDLKAINSLHTAQVEADLGIQGTYYFRVVPQSNRPSIISQIADLGHEIGYHYEDLTICKGNHQKAIAHFEKQLNYFRRFYPVRTICMHGSPMTKWDNKDLWKHFDYRDYGIIGEPYFDLLGANASRSVHYLTDTGRMWNGAKYSVRDKVSEGQILNYKTTHVNRN